MRTARLPAIGLRAGRASDSSIKVRAEGGTTMKRLLALALGLVCAVPAAAGTNWPNGAKAAVVLTYDDALDSQLDHAVPVLDAAGFKATFFLAGVKLADVLRWRAVAAEGHELANHTI